MGEQVTIERRFRGPPSSAHGGYACGLAAVHLDARVASVSLRHPPPLETPLTVRHDADSRISLLDGERVIAEAEPAELSVEIPAIVSAAEAEAASVQNPWTDKHPFPGCFGCGPDRDPSEAIRVIPGEVPERDVFADSWTPDPSLADDDGQVSKLFTWAALDCPTAAPAIAPGSGPHVLARLTADPELAPIMAGEKHIVVAWLIERGERKSRGGAVIFKLDGTPCAVSEGLWIKLRDPSVVEARTEFP